jgi:hypothetical protein
MIDDAEKVDFLMGNLKLLLPIETRLTQRLIDTLKQKSPDISIPAMCNVIDVLYTRDEAGVLCCLDIGGPETKAAHLVSITHLSFDRHAPLYREIEAYQRHRIKKLKKQQSRGY